jgi:predicted ferric reductase
MQFSKKMLKSTTAVASYHEDFDIIRLEVRPVSPLVYPAPGQFYFLYQPFSWRGYENHPFSLAAWNYESSIAPRKGAAELVPSKGAGEKEFSIHIASTLSTSLESASSKPSNFPTPTQPGPTLIFWIRPYNGWTRRVRDSCKKSNGVYTSTFLFEGPYGHSAPLYTYDTVIMVVGGTGISGAVSRPGLDNGCASRKKERLD